MRRHRRAHWVWANAGLIGLSAAEQRVAELRPVPLAAKVDEVTCGYGHTCARFGDGSESCWGAAPPDGQSRASRDRREFTGNAREGRAVGSKDLALTDGALGAAALQEHECVRMTSGRLQCLSAHEVRAHSGHSLLAGGHPPLVDLGSGRTVLSMCSGLAHHCAILDNCATKCWGANDDGQLGYGDTLSRRRTDVGFMGDHLPEVDFGGEGLRARQLSCGARHTCAIVVGGSDDNWQAGALQCWGWNGRGQLRSQPVRIRSSSLRGTSDDHPWALASTRLGHVLDDAGLEALQEDLGAMQEETTTTASPDLALALALFEAYGPTVGAVVGGLFGLWCLICLCLRACSRITARRIDRAIAELGGDPIPPTGKMAPPVFSEMEMVDKRPPAKSLC